MESRKMNFNENGRDVQITINHYHNEVINNQRDNNFLGNAFGMMALMGAMQNFAAPLLAAGFGYRNENNEEKNLIEDKNVKYLSKGSADGIEYEIVDDIENNEFLHFSIESSKKLGKKEEYPMFKGSLIQDLDIQFEKDVEFEKLYTSSIHRNLYVEIQKRLSIMQVRTDLFLVSSFLDKDGNKIESSSTVFYNSNICEKIIERYSKNGKYVILNEIVARKVNLPFAPFINKVNIASELNGCYKIEKTETGHKYKISKIVDS